MPTGMVVNRFVLTLCTLVLLWASHAAAQDRSIGGHVGVALPLISRSEGEITMMTDAVAISFPVGVVFRKTSQLPIDIAVVPTLLDDGRLNFAIGLNTVRGIGRGYAGAFGMLVDVTNRSWGFAPGLDKVLRHMDGGKVLVGDLVVPVMFHKDSAGAAYTSIGMGAHIGIGF